MPNSSMNAALTAGVAYGRRNAYPKTSCAVDAQVGQRLGNEPSSQQT